MNKKFWPRAVGQLTKQAFFVIASVFVGASGDGDSSVRVLAGVILFIGLESLRVWDVSRERYLEKLVAEMAGDVLERNARLEVEHSTSTKQLLMTLSKMKDMAEEIDELDERLRQNGIGRADIPRWGN